MDAVKALSMKCENRNKPMIAALGTAMLAKATHIKVDRFKITSGVLRILKRMPLVEQDDSGHDVIANSDADTNDPLAGIQACRTAPIF